MHILSQKICKIILALAFVLLLPVSVTAELYRSTINEVDVSFEYPKDWKLREVKGRDEKYNEISILGPRSEEDKYSCALSVTMYPKERFASVEEAIRDYKYKFEKFKEFKVVSSGKEGFEIEYLLRLPLYSPKAKDVKIKEKVMFVTRDDNCFKLRWNSVEKDYSKYLPAFNTLCETFQ
jgi:hypothetical protein